MKPQPKIVKVYNLIDVLMEIQATVPAPGFYERVWDRLCEMDMMSNGSTISDTDLEVFLTEEDANLIFTFLEIEEIGNVAFSTSW